MGYEAKTERYDKMTYHKAGRTGLRLPAISLGLWHQFGAAYSPENARSMLRAAFDAGIVHFDLANNYGPPPGSAEEMFGRMLKTDFAPYRDELVISTKAGYDMWKGPYGNGGSKKHLTASLNQSLKRLGLDYVDLFYSHRSDPETPLEETMETLAGFVRQGKALYVGLSNYSPEETERAADLLQQLGVRLAIHQTRYSMFHRDPEKGLLDVLDKKGAGCIAFAPLAQGLLTTKYVSGIPETSRAKDANSPFLQAEHITERAVSKAQRLNNIAKERGQSLPQMALSWLLKDARMTSVLIGASRAQQIEENVQALQSADFSNEELSAIEFILSEKNEGE
ncbi:L-glyceraldehyde 3-phosphate reductase [Bacillus halotolerans]|uniref:L-glyceraldehyde 3-phosphate reductase n=1 Tax=Bacillus halotolerans TaxID=260554 RepID=UPI000FDB9FC7|nr:L-glyceraldehyde 3-phosphate reductase [Bacillus halotolerans]AZV48667.1 L-glyceraldehyde 3-phosphate reductase [Bacillus halotolerans]WJE43853.1 L-glyceraldehyde 3-phosphate reductase [Bacillus halotolerans]WOC57636.1 L-glyceraldehyde 3-phosphate reductase [Bacillus halotolerans]